MKTDTVYKQAFNAMLPLLAQWGIGARIPSENELSARLGVSRTTVRKVLSRLTEQNYLRPAKLGRVVFEVPSEEVGFPETQTLSASEQVERRFLEWMLRGDARPGTQINELELARQFGVATTGVREFLNRFRRFGLIEKRPNSGWWFMGFTAEFASELFEIREMFELRSAAIFGSLDPVDPRWGGLDVLEAQHHQLLDDIEVRFHDFSDLDNRFHRFINGVAPNRFISDFYEIITFVFHYHYQWNKIDERQRNEAAIIEHLDYIEALKSREKQRIEAACRRHLMSARRTLISSTAAGE